MRFINEHLSEWGDSANTCPPSAQQYIRPCSKTSSKRGRSASLFQPTGKCARRTWTCSPSLSLLRGGIILDLGANIGDWTAAVLRGEPDAQIIAVEPAPEPREVLKRRFGNRITIDSRAISSKKASAIFHITRHTHNASLHAPHPHTDALYGGSEDGT